MILLYSCAIFTSAFLLFWIQPLFSKMVLPFWGGTPAVWTTCMLFFQSALLAGYAFIHLQRHWIGTKAQTLFHGVLLVVGFFFLPLSISPDEIPSSPGFPVWALLSVLTLQIGWLFFVIAMTAPLLQHWFSRLQHQNADDPYFLYASSNAGSLLALLGYPLILEPFLGLSRQSTVWSVVYAVFVGLILACACTLWMSREALADLPAEPSQEPGRPVDIIDRLQWFFYSLVPSSLLLGVTTYMTTDVAAIPLLWVIPLALYLVTFILAFSQPSWFRPSWLLNAQPYWLAPPLVLYFWGSKTPLFINFPIHLFAFFVSASICHNQLADKRPSPRHLTEFYFWIAAGGMAGGVVNSIFAPMLFSSTLEYPLAIAAAFLLRPRIQGIRPNTNTVALGLLVGLLILLLGPVMGNAQVAYHFGVIGLLIATSFLVAYFYSRLQLPVIWGLFFCFVVLAEVSVYDGYRKVVLKDRSFFGPVYVRMDPTENYYLFYHGTTLHGAQNRQQGKRNQAVTYFTQSGPLGQLFHVLNSEHPQSRRIAIAGLGVGNITVYGRPGDEIDYYEIDPLVEKVARNELFFTFLSQSSAHVNVILGDARLTLGQSPNQHYDLIIMDAFSSGSIPVHLVTREAFHMIRQKLKPDGLLVYNISNRFLDLEPLLATLAGRADWNAFVRRDLKVSPEEKAQLKFPSIWLVMGPPSSPVSSLDGVAGWRELEPVPGYPVWTDDYSNLLSAIRSPVWK